MIDIPTEEQISEQLLQRFANDESGKSVRLALDYALGCSKKNPLNPRSIDVAGILLPLNVDEVTLTATLLSDPRLHEAFSISKIREQFGESVAKLVENIHWLNTFNDYSPDIISIPKKAEALRCMLLATVKDMRAVLVRLAYRLQHLKLLPQENAEIRHYIARETMDIYCPLANRLGLGQLKWELEDLSFRYLEPEVYKKLAKSLSETRRDREAYIHRFTRQLSTQLDEEGISAQILGRPKHIYSIWRKMHRKKVSFESLYDLRAVRIIVDRISTCYTVLGLIHSHWSYIPSEFDDYIANPKENGYQSLHTVILGPGGAPVEIQIRTEEMNEFAESGIAAHWRYKEGGKQDEAITKNVNSIRKLLENKDDSDNDLLSTFESELFSDRIFVLTPKGEVLDLIKGSTPLDFAYTIHTEVGHRCRGAKINGRIVPLGYALKTGEQVEILTAKHGGPNRNWLNPHMGYLKTSQAKSKVRSWFKQRDNEHNKHAGKSILEHECQRLDIRQPDMHELLQHFHLNSEDELLTQLGKEEITAAQLATALRIPELPLQEVKKGLQSRNKPASSDSSIVTVRGVGNLLTHIAQCCHPMDGDAIIGYITLGHGVSIHRQDCENILQLTHDKQRRLIDVDWGNETEEKIVKIRAEAYDRQGLLLDITRIFSKKKINILDIHTHHEEDQPFVFIDLTISVKDNAELSNVITHISHLRNIHAVRRRG